MKRSVTTYICDNKCGTEANVEFVQDSRKKDVPLPEGWLDIITIDNRGVGMNGQYCPGCVRAINFALMEVKLLKGTEDKLDIPAEELKMEITPTSKFTNKPNTKQIADILQKNVDVNKMVDVSIGAEELFNVSRLKFNHALKILKDEGYLVHTKHDTQKGTDARSVIRVLTTSDINLEDIQAKDVYPVEVTKKGIAKLFAKANS